MDVIRVGVLGHPITHSLSPAIFTRFANHFGFECEFLLISAISYPEAYHLVRDFSLDILNITSPFKMNAAQEVQNEREKRRIVQYRCSALAAVNSYCYTSLSLSDPIYADPDMEYVIADNTDLFGVQSMLESNNLLEEVSSKEVYILGAGGASKAVIAALCGYKNKINIISRYPEVKRPFFSGLLKSYPVSLNWIELNEPNQKVLESIASDSILFSTLPADTPLPDLPWENFTLVLDSCYIKSTISKMAASLNIRYVNGGSWLISQAWKTLLNLDELHRGQILNVDRSKLPDNIPYTKFIPAFTLDDLAQSPVVITALQRIQDEAILPADKLFCCAYGNSLDESYQIMRREGHLRCS